MAADSLGLALLLFPLLLAIASAAGTQILRWAGVTLDSRWERFVFGAAVGLGVLAYLILAVGLLGGFNRWAFVGVVAVLGVIGGPVVLNLTPRPPLRRGEGESNDGDPFPPLRVGEGGQGGEVNVEERLQRAQLSPGRGERLLAALAFGAAVLLAGMTLLAALAPPGGNDWDGLAYHLAAPKVYLREGRIHFIVYDSHTNFPFAMEMLYGLGLALAGSPLAKLFHWGTGALTALAIGTFCARLNREKPLPLWVPPLAAALFLAVPQIAWEATTAYIDLGTTLFQFLALYALLIGVVASSRRRVVASFALAGAMSGWAMGTKMTALLPFGLLVIAAGYWALRRREREAWRATAALVVLGVVVASPWYLKSYLWTNNPVYPFFYSLFPKSVNWTAEAESAYKEEQKSFGLGHDATAFLWTPWNTAFEGSAYFIVPTNSARRDPSARGKSLKALGDVLGSVGISLLAFVPLWLFAARIERHALWLLAYVGGSLLLWFALTHQTRYLLPVLAPTSVLVGLLLAALPSSSIRIAAGGAAAAMVIVGLITTQRVILAPTWDVVTGRESREAYAARTLPDIYPALQFVNTLPNDARVAFFQETRGYYADRDYFWANPLQHNLIPYETFPDGASMVRFLRDRLGLTHVLVNIGLSRGSEGTHWFRQLLDARRTGALQPLYESRSAGVYAIR